MLSPASQQKLKLMVLQQTSSRYLAGKRKRPVQGQSARMYLDPRHVKSQTGSFLYFNHVNNVRRPQHDDARRGYLDINCSALTPAINRIVPPSAEPPFTSFSPDATVPAMYN
ncbi:hypothetical protein E4U54_004448 [Claviceps lovelessii]|nr:hypothetical protein E4U54_004448 [Claviceps lovelessii]